MGECVRTGTLVCDANGDAYCNAEPGEPTLELCDTKDNDCDGNVDEENPEGGDECNTALLGVCAVGTRTCILGTAQVSCVPNVLPGGDPLTGGTPEVCDSQDNDCDGIVDNVVQEALDAQGQPIPGTQEAAGEPCTSGVGTCQQAGQLSCVGTNIRLECNASPLPAGIESCDGDDNDCDGNTDEGAFVRTDIFGNQETREADLDDPNCVRGNLNTQCTSNLGRCERSGTTVCSSAGVRCDLDELAAGENESDYAPIAELCNGVDDNCDGQVDENNPGGDVPCDTGLEGICAAGTKQCLAESLTCVQDETPVPEIGDGLDNDCDGRVDETFQVWENPAAPELVAQSCTVGIGQCERTGIRICNADDPTRLSDTCSVEAGTPQAEVCNALDDDCDGQMDERLEEIPEVCNGVDDNCNNQVDEGFNVWVDPGAAELTPWTAILGLVHAMPRAFGFVARMVKQAIAMLRSSPLLLTTPSATKSMAIAMANSTKTLTTLDRQKTPSNLVSVHG